MANESIAAFTNESVNSIIDHIKSKEMATSEGIQELGIVFLTIVIAFIAKYITLAILRQIEKKNDDLLDEKTVKRLSSGSFWIVIILGLFLAARTYSVFDPYMIWVNRFFFTSFILVCCVIFSSTTNSLMGHWFKVKKKYERAPQLITRIVTVIIFMIGLLMILSFIGIQITPIIATLGIGGLAVGLAMQPTLTNFFAGLQIISDKPVEVGDFVEIENGSIKGTVLDIGWRSTRLKTLANELIIVPNNKMADSIIKNDTSVAQNEINLVISCGVSYNENLERVEKITLEVANKIIKKMNHTVKDYEPRVRFNEFADSNINFNVIIRVNKYNKQFEIRHEFIKALKERYDEEGINISYPVRKIIYEDNNNNFNLKSNISNNKDISPNKKTTKKNSPKTKLKKKK